MRLKLTLSPNTSVVGFDYQQKLLGVLHKWIGENDIHGKISLYSFSSLLNGRLINGGFNFKNGAVWLLSFFDEKYVKQIIRNILADPAVFSGMSVTDVLILPDLEFNEDKFYRFNLLSPIFLKRRLEDGSTKFYFYDNQESNALMVENLKHKMSEAGLPEDDTLEIKFDLSYPGKKIKMITIHGIKNKCSMCPILIKAKPETISFVYDVGIGNLTGSGFGYLEY